MNRQLCWYILLYYCSHFIHLKSICECADTCPNLAFCSLQFTSPTPLSSFILGFCPDMYRDILSSFTLVHFANFAHIVDFRVCPDICPGGLLSSTLCTLMHFAHFRLMSGHMSGHLCKVSKVSEVSDMTFSRRDGALWPQGGQGASHRFTSLRLTLLTSVPLDRCPNMCPITM